MMNTEELDRLLDKYYKSESTEEDENILRAFFSTGDIPEGYEAEKEIFSYYLASASVPEPSDDFEDRIMKGVSGFEMMPFSGKFRKSIIPFLSVAATLLILVGSYFFFVNRNETKDTFSDPKLAYAETMRILRNVSAKLNRGTSALEPVSKMNEVTVRSFETLNRSTKTIGKNLMNLEYLQKAIDIVNVPIAKNVNK
jgi:hypothetical protein